MHAQSTAGQVAGLAPTDLVLERLPNGELAWLRPEAHPDVVLDRVGAPLPDDARFTIAERGREVLEVLARERAMKVLFGPAPTVAQVLTISDLLGVSEPLEE